MWKIGRRGEKRFLLKWNAIKLGHGQLPVGTVRLPDSSAVQLRLDRSLYRRRYLLLFLAATRLLVRLKIRQSTHYRIPDRPQNYASLNPWYWNYFSIVSTGKLQCSRWSFLSWFPLGNRTNQQKERLLTEWHATFDYHDTSRRICPFLANAIIRIMKVIW